MAAEPVEQGAASPPASAAELPTMPSPLMAERPSRGDLPAQLPAADYGPMPSFGDKPAPACRVPGCTERLTQLYNMRHRVCVTHYRAEQFYMEPGGPLCRFCQQCAKPHTLDRFAEGRRSCRESLLRHNRRRKPLAHGSATPKRRSSAPEHDAGTDGSGGTDSTAMWQPRAEPAGPAASSLSGLNPDVAALLMMPLPQMLAAQLPGQQSGRHEGSPIKRARSDAAAAAPPSPAAASQGRASPSSGEPGRATVVVQRSSSTGLLRPQHVVAQPQLHPQLVAGPAAPPAAGVPEQAPQVDAMLASLLAAAAMPAPQPAAAPDAALAAAAPQAVQVAPMPPGAAGAAEPPQQQQQQQQQQQAAAVAALPVSAAAVDAELLQTVTALQQRVRDLEHQLAMERAQRAQRAANRISQVGAAGGVQLLRALLRAPGTGTGAGLPGDPNPPDALGGVLRRPDAAAAAAAPSWQASAVPAAQPQPQAQPQVGRAQTPAQSWVGGGAQQQAPQAAAQPWNGGQAQQAQQAQQAVEPPALLQQVQKALQQVQQHMQPPAQQPHGPQRAQQAQQHMQPPAQQPHGPQRAQQAQREQQAPADVSQLLIQYAHAMDAQAQSAVVRPQATTGQAPPAVVQALLQQRAQRAQRAQQPGGGSGGGAAPARAQTMPASSAQRQPDEVPGWVQSMARLMRAMSEGDAPPQRGRRL